MVNLPAAVEVRTNFHQLEDLYRIGLAISCQPIISIRLIIGIIRDIGIYQAGIGIGPELWNEANSSLINSINFEPCAGLISNYAK